MIKKLFFWVVFFVLGISTYAQQVQTVNGMIIINDGAKVTSAADKKVNLTIKYINATQMMISNDPSFVGIQWEPVAPQKLGWRLHGEDGIKTIYAKFRDAKGNVSDVVEASIELDRVGPQNPSIIINGGKDYTNHPHRMVMLELSAEDAAQMRISNRPDFLGANWIPFKEHITGWVLTPKDGPKQVYAQFKDNAGNLSEIVSDNIYLDLQPPTNCKITIENGEPYVNKRVVKVHVSAEGATEMAFKGSEGWIPYAPVHEVDLGEPDGEKSVFVKFRDEVGNQSAVISAKVILDREPPKNTSIIINDGNKYVKSHNEIHIKLTAVGATEMILSLNDSTFSKSKWIPFAPLIPQFVVDDVDGIKTIYVKFRDAAGNVSPTISDDIILDKAPPKNQSVEIRHPNMRYDSLAKTKVLATKDRLVSLHINSENADYMMISNQSTFYGSNWEVFKPVVEKWHLGGTNDGNHSVFLKFRDKAGNISQVVSDMVVIDNEPPVDNKVIINNNDEFCTDKDKRVTLTIFSRGAAFMSISNDPGFLDAKWEPYATSKSWILAGEDGIKTVFVKFKDWAGNESQTVVDNIILDRKPPYETSIIINKGQTVTNNPDRIVIVKVKAKEAVLMQIDNSPDFKTGRWQRYSEENINHQLSDVDGIKRVYARFKDDAGNVSEPIYAEIKLDRKPPMEGTVEINGGDKITNNADKQVILNIYAKDATQMMISNDFFFRDAQWQPYQTEVPWTLTGPDGLKTVYVKFKDEIGNESKVAYATIGVDRQAPKEGRFSINEGATYCTDVNKYVTLKLYAVDAAEMLISNKPDMSDAQWRKYQMILERWILDGEDGEKKVYVKFRDKAGNETSQISASIILDRQEPVGEEIIINNGEKYTNNPQNKVNLEIRALGDVYEMMLSNNEKFVGAKWEPYRSSIPNYVLTGKDGEKKLYVKFRDKAGNESAVASASIILDTEPPIPMIFTINNGKTATDNPKVTLQIKAKGAKFMRISNSIKFDDNSIWEDYAETKEWLLPSGEGLKRVYIKFKDEAQNESPIRTAEITLFKSF
ncbi:MAG: hypothetical protein NZM38_03895 [Cytophagales bacterium]|nr:hypothetical protein [Cytophagales bacterium]MDW8383894.1 hypothetical protein [Flammeovirgaceae bacterium]